MRDEEVLGAFREDPLPPSGVDVARAVRTGRRRQRLRTAGAAGGLAVLLAVSGFAVPAWLQGGGAGPGQTAATPGPTEAPRPPDCTSPGPRAIASASPALGAAPAEFPLLRHWVDVSRVPGLRVDSHTTARHWQRVVLTDGSGQGVVDIQVFARDGKPMFSDGPGTSPTAPDLDRATPAEPVGGRTAVWLPGRQALYQHDVARLGWQWSDGGWAFVAAADRNLDGRQPTAAQTAALRATAHRVAGALRIREGTPVTMPFTVAGPPAGDCLRLTSTNVYHGRKSDGTAFTMSTLTFSRADNTDPMRFPPDVIATVTADSAATPQDRPGSINGQVDGHPAVIGDTIVTVHDLAGFAVEVSAQLPHDRLLAYTRTVQVIDGAHADLSKWTDRPLRP